jgi:hypothetical protein
MDTFLKAFSEKQKLRYVWRLFATLKQQQKDEILDVDFEKWQNNDCFPCPLFRMSELLPASEYTASGVSPSGGLEEFSNLRISSERPSFINAAEMPPFSFKLKRGLFSLDFSSSPPFLSIFASDSVQAFQKKLLEIIDREVRHRFDLKNKEISTEFQQFKSQPRDSLEPVPVLVVFEEITPDIVLLGELAEESRKQLPDGESKRFDLETGFLRFAVPETKNFLDDSKVYGKIQARLGTWSNNQNDPTATFNQDKNKLSHRFELLNNLVVEIAVKETANKTERNQKLRARPANFKLRSQSFQRLETSINAVFVQARNVGGVSSDSKLFRQLVTFLKTLKRLTIRIVDAAFFTKEDNKEKLMAEKRGVLEELLKLATEEVKQELKLLAHLVKQVTDEFTGQEDLAGSVFMADLDFYNTRLNKWFQDPLDLRELSLAPFDRRLQVIVTSRSALRREQLSNEDFLNAAKVALCRLLFDPDKDGIKNYENSRTETSGGGGGVGGGGDGDDDGLGYDNEEDDNYDDSLDGSGDEGDLDDGDFY